MINRTSFEKKGFLLCPAEESDFVDFPESFCGDEVIDRFFYRERKEFEDNLFVKTYKFVEVKEPSRILGLASIANASLMLEEYKQRKAAQIPLGIDDLEHFPAVKIERFAILEALRNNGFGSILMQMIKEFFVCENRTGCRFIMVESLPAAVEFYKKNKFETLIDENINPDEIDPDDPVDMYFNLLNS
jgi:ribosomal protein S18 acetylase RimI-like enzyme